MTNKLIKIMLVSGMLALGLLALAFLKPVDGRAVAADPTPAPAPTLAVPFVDEWTKSPHNGFQKDKPGEMSEAFTHWDEADPKVVQQACAKCHSTPGYQDYLGADGSKPLVVDKAPATGTTIQCVACHNGITDTLSSVQFNSTVMVEDKAQPVVISGLGPEARCMVCHQGTASMTQVDAQIEKFKATDPDAVVAPIKENGKDVAFGFINVHYYAAAITLYGNEVKGGYQYEGKAYDAKNDHTAGYDTCVGCHDPHSTELKVKECGTCHTGVTTVEALRKVREPSSAADYDGDANIKEGMADEITGMRAALYKGILTYAKEVVQTGIIFDAATYPYWLQDKDGDNKIDKNEQGGNIGYTTWTPRLLKAAYNYQIATKDPGAYAHGNKYIIQLLYDSLEDLNTKLTTKVPMDKMARDDAGHFAGNSEAFRHWDAEGMAVPGSCAKCHSAGGLPQFLKEGVAITNPASNGFACSTCHNSAEWPKVYEVKDVTFPSGKKVTFAEGATASNLCLQCHQGRESAKSVGNAVAGLDADTPSEKLSFRNVHYFAAGATLFGSDAQGMFEYKDKAYAAQFAHTKGVQTCTDCHEKHELVPDTAKCAGCHSGAKDPTTIRLNSKEDYDGDGDVKEGIAGEIATYQETLYKAIQAYAKDVVKAGIVYDAHAHPYFFLDKDGDGKPDKTDKGANINYNTFWTPRLLQAAYNYQFASKDPGAYVHNGKYVLQALYDSLEDLNTKLPTKIDMSKMVRPK